MFNLKIFKIKGKYIMNLYMKYEILNIICQLIKHSMQMQTCKLICFSTNKSI